MSDSRRTTKKEDSKKVLNDFFWSLDDIEEGLKSNSLEEKKEILWILRNLLRLNK